MTKRSFITLGLLAIGLVPLSGCAAANQSQDAACGVVGDALEESFNNDEFAGTDDAIQAELAAGRIPDYAALYVPTADVLRSVRGDVSNEKVGEAVDASVTSFDAYATAVGNVDFSTVDPSDPQALDTIQKLIDRALVVSPEGAQVANNFENLGVLCGFMGDK